jgi:hypothetical protein
MFTSPGDRAGRRTNQVPAFYAYLTGALNLSGSSVPTAIPLTATLFDTHSHFNISASQGRYTVAIPGIYHFDWCAQIQSSISTLTGLYASLAINGVEKVFGTYSNAAGGGVKGTSVGSCLYQCNAGDLISLVGFGTGGGTISAQAGSSGTTFMCGHLVRGL